MKEILVFIITILAMGSGFYVMRYVDCFLGQIDHKKNKLDCIVNKKVLLLPIMDVNKNVEIKKILDHLKVTYETLDGPHLAGTENCDYIMALSDNDMDNLVLCREAKQYLGNIYTIAICNDKQYEMMFRNSDVDTVVFGYEYIKKMLLEQAVLG